MLNRLLCISLCVAAAAATREDTGFVPPSKLMRWRAKPGEARFGMKLMGLRPLDVEEDNNRATELEDHGFNIDKYVVKAINEFRVKKPVLSQAASSTTTTHQKPAGGSWEQLLQEPLASPRDRQGVSGMAAPSSPGAALPGTWRSHVNKLRRQARPIIAKMIRYVSEKRQSDDQHHQNQPRRIFVVNYQALAEMTAALRSGGDDQSVSKPKSIASYAAWREQAVRWIVLLALRAWMEDSDPQGLEAYDHKGHDGFGEDLVANEATPPPERLELKFRRRGRF